MMTLALLWLMQAQPPQPTAPPPETRPAPWPDPEREMPGGTRIDRTPTPEARQTMMRFAECVLDKSPEKAREVLVRDFRTTEYRNGLKNLARNNEGCARQVGLRGSMRSGNLPMAAALAEASLERGDTTPLNARLARAATGSKAIPFSPHDEIALCVARSTPDDVAALFATEPGSDAETQATAKVEQVAKLCARGAKLEMGAFGLRSVIATASYRLIAGHES